MSQQLVELNRALAGIPCTAVAYADGRVHVSTSDEGVQG